MQSGATETFEGVLGEAQAPFRENADIYILVADYDCFTLRPGGLCGRQSERTGPQYVVG